MEKIHWNNMDNLIGKNNQNYEIIEAIAFEKRAVVLGENPNSPTRFVTWAMKDDNTYDYGHYHNHYHGAKQDLLQRSIETLDGIKNRDRLKELSEHFGKETSSEESWEWRNNLNEDETAMVKAWDRELGNNVEVENDNEMDSEDER